MSCGEGDRDLGSVEEAQDLETRRSVPEVLAIRLTNQTDVPTAEESFREMTCFGENSIR